MSYVQEVLLLVIFCFAIITLIAGAVMLTIPYKLHALAEQLDKTVSTEKYFAIFDRTKNLERHFYKYHYIFGAFIVIGAVYTVFILSTMEIPYAVLPNIVNRVVSEWLYSAFFLIIVVTCSLSILVGMIVFFRPSLLKSFEGKMNTWIDTTSVVGKLDTQRMLEQQKPLKYPRLYGAIIFIGSIYILWATVPYVLN